MNGLLKTGLVSAGIALLSGVAAGQAPPGPMTPPPASSRSAKADPLPPPMPVVKPRESILGRWKLNKDESDDQYSRDQERTQQDDNRNQQQRYPQGGIGFPGGGIGGGGMGGHGGHNGQGQGPTESERQKMRDLFDPSVRLLLEQAPANAPKIELTGDQYKKLVFYTDGRKLEVPKDDSLKELAARWDGGKLVSEETLPKNAGTLTRAYELSPDKTQLYVELHFLGTKKNSRPIEMRYVYDQVIPTQSRTSSQ